ncbi:beta-glucosidase 13-like [Pyrus communis]|uniref:beta-glucosidase 13-like n=1 Tax=Pyrus communis TaxID=23211 RepID=UPI0035C1CA7F
MSLGTRWFVPVSKATRHRNAANRSLDFMFGWFMEPMTSGQYPHSMQVLVKERLPKFTEEESKLIKGSFDFVGINYYTTYYSRYQPHNNSANASYLTDARVFESTELNGVPLGPPAASSWLVVYPKGIQEILLYTKHKYNDPLIYITENGVDEFNDPTLSLPQSLNDTHRIDYHYHHLDYLRKAINDGVNVKGYFSWSLMDNFEWTSGYTVRFGFVYIDHDDGLKRHPKLSATWFKYFLG